LNDAYFSCQLRTVPLLVVNFVISVQQQLAAVLDINRRHRFAGNKIMRRCTEWQEQKCQHDNQTRWHYFSGYTGKREISSSKRWRILLSSATGASYGWRFS